jgi:hypothetical protein
MKIYQYKDYDEYVTAQTEANLIKINLVHVSKVTIKKIVKLHGHAESVLCHGTRNAAEQKFFKEFYPGADIVGTEISYSATQFPMTVQWDFHKENTDWIGRFDIVYSNSFDHSIDPVKALTVWQNQLTNNGKIYLEHSFHVRARSWDPLEIEVNELLDLFEQVGLTVLSQEKTQSNTKWPSEVFQLGKKI